jgi:CheY-like chemotaxis protein
LSVIKVCDSGIGIEKENIDLIFHEFRQASEGYKRKYEGVGLGLSITKKFVEIMNGTINVESTPGVGSVFTLKFFKHVGLNQIKGEKEKAVELPGELENWKKNKILLVEDDESTVEIIRLILKNICVVSVAENGEKALEMVKKNKYSIILMDIVLGYGMNGIETSKEIRKIKGYDSLPIVAVTAYAMPEDKAKFIDEGLTNYISKPFDLNQFRKFIVEMLREGK